MKIRPFPVVLSLVGTLVVLFGSWSLYEWKQVKRPLAELLEQEAQVTDYDVNVKPHQLAVQLEVTPAFSLTEDYLALLENIKEQSKIDQVSLIVDDHPNDHLQRAWHDMYFILAEGITKREYFEMSERLKTISLGDHIDLQVAMDAENVYVWLRETNEGHTLFRTLSLKTGGETDA